MNIVLPTPRITSTQEYVERGPITVTSDFQLNNSGFPGNGTIDDPIRIQGYNITASSGDLIFIQDTTFYFQIENNYLNGLTTADHGINFQNVLHGKIENNTICNFVYYGILFGDPSGCNNNTIANNTVYNTGGHGIFIKESNYNTIEGNTVFNTSAWGINVAFSHYNVICHNTAYENSVCGLGLGGSSTNNRIYNNTIHHSNDYGIFLDSSNINLIVNNTAHDNEGNGIFIESSYNNTISNNTVSRNGFCGIFHRSSGSNIISHNILHDNDMDGINLHECENSSVSCNTVYNNENNGIAQDTSNNISILNNSVFNNLNGITPDSSDDNNLSYNIVYDNNNYGIWIFDSNYNTISGNIIFNNANYGVLTDSTSTGNTVEMNDFMDNKIDNTQAVDDGVTNVFESNYWSDWAGIGSYTIDGSTDNLDPSPLMNPFHISTPAFITPTTDSITLIGDVIIQWTPSSDSFGHALTYSILYSANDGETWTNLVTDLTTTTYTLDTTTIAEGMIHLKVQAVDAVGFISQTVSAVPFLVDNEDLDGPIILSPNGGETLTGSTTLTWSAAYDSADHTITYTVYYSADEGATWTELVSGLTLTSYSWDTTEVPNGLSYLVKVVATCSEGAIAEDVSDDTFAVHNEIATSTTTPTTSSEITPGLTVISLILILGTVIVVRRNREN